MVVINIKIIILLFRTSDQFSLCGVVEGVFDFVKTIKLQFYKFAWIQ